MKDISGNDTAIGSANVLVAVDKATDSCLQEVLGLEIATIASSNLHIHFDDAITIVFTSSLFSFFKRVVPRPQMEHKNCNQTQTASN